jgi:hypothetical protein
MQCHLIGDTPECSLRPAIAEATEQVMCAKKHKSSPPPQDRQAELRPPINLWNRVDPNDFANEMRRKYPNMVSNLPKKFPVQLCISICMHKHTRKSIISHTFHFFHQAGLPIGNLLKEHNSSLLANINEIRHCTQLAMFKFVDNLVHCLAESCTCCTISGRDSCLLTSTVDNGMNLYQYISSFFLSPRLRTIANSVFTTLTQVVMHMHCPAGSKPPVDSKGNTNIGLSPTSTGN